jgi:hemerythrin superfamily protein
VRAGGRREIAFDQRFDARRGREHAQPQRIERSEAMDVTKMLEADHRTVEKLFDQIEKAQGAKRQPLIDELATALRAHMELEEEVLYPKMGSVTGQEAVEEGNKEHELARKALTDVVRLAPDDPGFGAALDAAKAGVHHHVEDEEGEVFPKLRKNGTQILDEIATPFMHKRIELGMPIDVDALAAAASKDELLEEAKSAGVDGAASMTKNQLAEALVSAMS